MLGNKNSYICLDIGSSAVKITQFQELRGELYLVKFRLEELPAGKEEAEPKKNIGIKLLEAVKGFDLKSSKILTFVSGPKVVVRQLVIPAMGAQEIDGAIRWQLKNIVPFPIETAVSDYEILGEIVERGAKKLKVLAAVTPKEEIDGLLELLIKAQMKPVFISTPPFSLCALAKKTKWVQEDKVTAIIDIGAQFTTISIVKNNTVVFSRDIIIGGNNISLGMVGTLISDLGQVELDYENAEKIKTQWGIPDEAKIENITPEITSPQISALLRPVLERLLKEIKRSFAFYREESHGDLVSKVVLVGGSGMLKRLPEFLNENLGVEVIVADLTKEVKTNHLSAQDKELFSKTNLRFSVCVGLGLTYASGINLAPPEIKDASKRKLQRWSLEATVTAFICFLLLGYGFFYLKSVNIKKKTLAVQIMQSTIFNQLQKTELIEDLQRKINYLQQIKNDITAGQISWDEVLKELSNIVPREVVFTSLVAAKGELVIRGVIYTPIEMAEAQLTKFMSILEESIFKDVVLVSMKKSLDEEAPEKTQKAQDEEVSESEEIRSSHTEFEIVCKVGK